MNNDIETLRAHLFKTLDGLADKTMDIDRAKAISDVSQTIINSAMAEVKHAQVTGKSSSAFLGATKKEELPNGILGRTVHRIGG